ncbi:hypothetical protein [Streptomyces sp. NPDC017868]|uniref:hypothetical protein n=1 Tax=Streptomyces sp. NPDC017868 TaxID=3365014 RepID=UPI0037A1F362
MTGPEQNRNARPEERDRDERQRHGGQDGRERYGAQDGRERRRQRYEGERYERERYEPRPYEGQNGGHHPGGRDRDEDPDPDADLDDGPAPDEGAEQRARPRARRRAAATGRPRGPLIGEYAPPYRRRSGRVAAVLLYRNGGHRVVWPDRVQDVDKPLFGSPYTVFEVRLGRNVTEFRLRLPAAGDGVFFDAVVKVQWVVTDPYLVVQEQVEDVAELLRDELLDGLRRLSRRFRITEAQRADEAVREELATGRLGFGRDIGLRTRVLVFIDLDASVRAEVSRRDRAGVSMEADERVAEAARRREAADRALVAERARELEDLLRRGDLAQIAHHMATHPDRQWEIRTRLQRERREGQEDYLRVLGRLLDTGVLERHDIGEQMYQVLLYLRSRTGDGPCRPRALEEASPEPGAPDRDEEHGGAPHAPRVYEPTRVESGSEREREREQEREREWERSRGRRDDGFDDGHDRYEPDAYERNDRYDRDDPYDREPRERPGRTSRSTRPARPGSDFDDFDDFDDWDDE